jgi:N-acetylmuramoyl-L-alanine amidase
MAYITNTDDERLLNQDSFQENIARSIAATIKKFFQDHP